jgi:hypothetical protein
MNESKIGRIPATSAAEVHSSPRRRLSPPKAIKFLLPVWGQRYIARFLDISLPTLLAPGNLPALAKTLHCEFVFLTSREDAEVLRAHPGCHCLKSVCDVDYQLIDDLITGDNYSTTITLAYERAVRATGAEMLDTCFFFLISDYIMANGSLGNLLTRMLAGASGILTGNFQIVEEDAIKTFIERFDRGTPELVIGPRDLVGWALSYLHPMTAANMVNFPLCTSTHSNRLFWRSDKNTLIGRYYLMHMICIRPEVTDFVIGSSCDYSFIPEMCPSNNVEVITDSDEYLVVEMQPRNHEQHFLRLGPVDVPTLARSLSEWTTARHRENVRFQLVFHAAELPGALSAFTHEADAFVAKVARRLRRKPQPHRDHPYWIDAINAHRWALAQKENQKVDPSGFLMVYNWHSRFVRRCLDILFGRAPFVRPWHPRWPDYRSLRGQINRLFSGPSRKLLILSATTMSSAGWSPDIAKQIMHLDLRRYAAIDVEKYVPLVAYFDGCLLFLDEEEVESAHMLIERIWPLLAPNGFLIIVVRSGRGADFSIGLGANFATRFAVFLDQSMFISETHFVPIGLLRRTAMPAMIRLYGAMIRSPAIYYPLCLIFGGFLLVGALSGNLLALRSGRKPSQWTRYSSMRIVLRPSDDQVHLPSVFNFNQVLYARAGRYKPKPSLVQNASQVEQA